MNALSDISLSPLQKLEEPCESWWIDWYPSGHAKPESVLYKSEKLRRPVDESECIFSAPGASFISSGAEFQGHEPKQPEAVPCMAQDLEQEIAELEEQARSVDMELDLDDFTGGLDYTHDSTSSLVTLGLEHQQVADMLQIPTVSRKLKLPVLNVEVMRKSKELSTAEPSDSNAGGSRGDLTPTSEDDTSTHISSSLTQASPHSFATHATSACAFAPEASKASKTAPFQLVAVPHQTAPPIECMRAIPSSSRPLSKANSLESNPSSSSLVAYSLPGLVTSEVQSEQYPTGGSCTRQDMADLCSHPKRPSTAGPTPMPAKLPRLERPRREAATARLQSTLDATVSGGLAGRAGTGVYKGMNDGRTGKLRMDGKVPNAKAGKGRGGKAATGAQRGKKRVISKCAPPAPGVHACSQCGAQSTPVWRAGPYGPKTLCNACGVRYMKIAKKK